MPSLRSPDGFRLNLHHAVSASSRWWARRPWADAMTFVDTTVFIPGRHNAAPLLRASRKPRRARRGDAEAMRFHVRPVAQSQSMLVRRGLDAIGLGYLSLELPAAVKLVPDGEVERLEQARRGIAFRPKKGFLHSTPVERLSRDLG